MTPDNISIITGVGLMLFFAVFGYLMTQIEATACPWEDDAAERESATIAAGLPTLRPRHHHS